MKYTQSFREALEEVRQVKEDGHTDVASAVRQCKTAIEDASQMLSKLQGMSPEGDLPSWWMNKIAIAANSMNKLRDYLLVPSTNENLKEEEQTVFTKAEVDKLKAEIDKLKVVLKQEKQKAQNAIPNRDTGEIPLQTGIAHAILKIKDKKQEDDAKRKMTSKQIDKLANESLFQKSLGIIRESEASDKAKDLGLDYLKFGRYGKDGKVTHKSIGGTLTAVGKDEKPIEDPKDKGAKKDEPKKDAAAGAEEIKIKSRNFLKDMEDLKLETDDGETIEPNFDEEDSWDPAVEKARSMGLDDLADELDSIAGRVMEMDYEDAQAEFQDLKSSLAGKPVKSVEFSRKADDAIEFFTNQMSMGKMGITKGNNFQGENIKTMAKDLGNTFKIIQKMVDSDETEGAVGSGNSSPMKGFRPEVIETLKSLEDISMNLEEVKDEIEDKFVANAEQVKDILSNIQDEIEFITDDSADHDGYTKPHKVNSAVVSISELIKSLKVKKTKTKKESFLFSNLKRKINEQDEDEEEILTDNDLVKEPSLKDIIKKNLRKKLKLDNKKSKVEVNPDVEIGVYSGGKNTPNGNLH